MRYHALAMDYDGTLAHHGKADNDTFAALERLRESRRRPVLVTGRRLDDLLSVFEPVEIFDRIVAENGAVLYTPATREERVLGKGPPPGFAERLRAAGAPVDTGRAIVATWEPHETAVLSALHDMGLEHQIIFNKGAVMVLPPGINKATGLTVALEDIGLSAHNAVAVGDAENDLALLDRCEFAVAVANALPSVKREVDWVTPGSHGRGVTELIDTLIADDLREFEPRLERRHLILGMREDGSHDRMSPYSNNILLTGSSGSGKSTFAAGFMERLAAQEYQFCCIDPEGDYSSLPNTIVLGTPMQAPVVSEVASVLGSADRNCVVNMLAVPLHERPAVFASLFADLLSLRVSTGRPHWILVDETHHLWPTDWETGRLILPEALHGMMFIVPHPERIESAVVRHLDIVVALGDRPEERFAEFGRIAGCEVPPLRGELAPDEVWVWRLGTEAPYRLRTIPPVTERRRHLRKYVEGEIDPERSFYFTGPAGALRLRASNLLVFVQLAAGLDDATWEFHLRRGDYSRWFKDVVKDRDLVEDVRNVEQDRSLAPRESRSRVTDAIDQRYTLPA